MKKSSYKERQGISYQAQSEPKFLTQFKQRIGFDNNQAQLKDKFADKESRELSKEAVHNEDEKPQVLIPEGEDIDAGEVDQYFHLKQKEVIDDKQDIEDAKKQSKHKILFRKPDKNKSSDKNPLNTTTKKRSNESTSQNTESVPKKKKKQKLKTNLLSFHEDE